jgi:hypothetical protein
MEMLEENMGRKEEERSTYFTLPYQNKPKKNYII